MTDKPTVLLVAEAANPEWVSVPLIGWSHSQAIARVVDAHVVTQVRNKAAIERAGWREGVEFTAIDSEVIAAPIDKANNWLRKVTGLGWTLTTAMEGVPYYLFEHKLWERFGAAIRAHQYDIVHRLTPLTPTVASFTLAKNCHDAGVPFIWGPVNGGVAWPKEFSGVQRAEGEWLSYVRDAHKLMPGFSATRRHASALIAGSMSAWDQFSEHQDKCVYLPENAIDETRFPPVEVTDAPLPLRVAFVGRLVPYKGADMLIRAAAPLVKAGKLIVDIIGDGPEMARLRALREAEGVTAGVLLDGWVPHVKLQERLRQSQVLGFPSVREFGGGVVLEAMACGLAPVVVGYAGPNELVSDSTGIRVALGTADQIVERMRQAFQRLLDNPEQLTSMRRRSRERVMTLFTWPTKAAQVLEIYRWVLGQREKPDFGMPLRDV